MGYPWWIVTTCLLAQLTAGCGGRSALSSGPNAKGTAAVAPARDSTVKGDVLARLGDAASLPRFDGSGGFPSSPGLVDCKGTLCKTASQFCCVENSGSKKIWQCRGLSQENKCGELKRYCDEAADCPAGQQCWVPWTARAFPDYSTHCAEEDSFQFWFQVCTSSAECVGGEPCVEQTCLGYPDQSYTIQSCGPLDPLFCSPG